MKTHKFFKINKILVFAVILAIMTAQCVMVVSAWIKTDPAPLAVQAAEGGAEEAAVIEIESIPAFVKYSAIETSASIELLSLDSFWAALGELELDIAAEDQGTWEELYEVWEDGMYLVFYTETETGEGEFVYELFGLTEGTEYIEQIYKIMPDNEFIFDLHQGVFFEVVPVIYGEDELSSEWLELAIQIPNIPYSGSSANIADGDELPGDEPDNGDEPTTAAEEETTEDITETTESDTVEEPGTTYNDGNDSTTELSATEPVTEAPTEAPTTTTTESPTEPPPSTIDSAGDDGENEPNQEPAVANGE